MLKRCPGHNDLVVAPWLLQYPTVHGAGYSKIFGVQIHCSSYTIGTCYHMDQDLMFILKSPKKCFKNKCKGIQTSLFPIIVWIYVFHWGGGRKRGSVATSKGNKRLDARDKWSISDMLGLFFSASSLLLLEDSKNNSYFTGWRSEWIPTVNTQLVH